MNNITLIKKLRNITKASILDCKNALINNNNNIESAMKELKNLEKNITEKRASFSTQEGLIKSIKLENASLMLEINSETDFVARDYLFHDFSNKVFKLICKTLKTEISEILKLKFSDGSSVEEERLSLTMKVGENIKIRRVAIIKNKKSIGIYNHLNRIGAMVALNINNENLAKDIAMQIAAMNPISISKYELSSVIIKEEKLQYYKTLEGKDSELIKKIVAGKLESFYQKKCLLNQLFIKDNKVKIADLLRIHDASIIEFKRFEIGM